MKSIKLRRLVVLLLICVMTFAGGRVFAFMASGESSGVQALSVSESVNEETDIEQISEDETADEPSRFYGTWASLLPPVIAILLALITKEVYSSLFIGILIGGMLYSGFSFEGTVVHVLRDGFVASIADKYNIGIILFLIVLGALVAMMNKTGASAAFGRWAAVHIKSRTGAQAAAVVLGMLIFIDDYFNCLTVGSVMRPVTDKHRVSRAKLAYIIDSTAAPVCIIAPISSWAAAVAGFVKEENVSAFELFLKAIPFNFYALFTILFMFVLIFGKTDYGPMKKHEENALNGDLFTSDAQSFQMSASEEGSPRSRVADLIFPVVVLIISCVVGMIYSGGFFSGSGVSFIEAFSGCDASEGLVYGSFATLVISIIYFIVRRVISFKDCMAAIPDGFKAMVPAIMILCCAWTLKSVTDSLGSEHFIKAIVKSSAGGFSMFMPAIIFVIAVVIAFATGTSWGTFGILIPIVLNVIPYESGILSVISISACMAGAVCGDHCSPISDTTIMASAGSNSNHINHVSTQLPYALTVAAISFASYLVSGVTQSLVSSYALNAVISLICGTAFTVITIAAIKFVSNRKA